MASTPCPDDGTLLSMAMGDEVAAAVRSHVDGCPECGRRVEMLRAEVHAIQDAPSTSAFLGTSEPAASAPPGPIPAVIGKYPVVGLLGDGAQGQVFRAVHPELRLDLAIKLARKPLDRGPDHDRLVTEGRLLADLDHPNLVRVYDLGLHDGRPFLAMELVRGCTLWQHARQCRPEPRRAAALIAELARAVAYLHARGVVHQDLKPDNVLMDEAGRPRLIDFGIARLRDAWSGEAHDPSGGTLAYMAPEQARGETERVGPRSDVFALGAILYFLLTGRAPFQGRDPGEVWNRARRGEFDRSAIRQRNVPRRLCRLVLRAMALEPASRQATAGALASELESIRHGPRRVAALALAGMASLAMGTAGGQFLWQRGKGQSDFAPTALAPLSTLKGIDLEVYESSDPDRYIRGNSIRQGLSLKDSETLPLRPRDWIKIKANVNRPAYLYIIWFDTEGKPVPLWPWLNNSWSLPSHVEPPREVLTLPYRLDGSGSDIFALSKGPPGTEALLLLARDTPLSLEQNEALKQALARQPPIVGVETASAVWLVNGERIPDEATRGAPDPPKAGSSGDVTRGAPDPSKTGSSGAIEVQVGNLMKELRKIFPYSNTVFFENQGDR